MDETPISPRNSNVIPIGIERRRPIEQPRNSWPRSQQLALQFDAPHRLIVVVTDQLHGANFVRALVQLRPKLIIDSRFAPHFNFIALDSLIAKEQIFAIDARYVSFSIPFHEFSQSLLKHNPTELAERISLIVRKADVQERPLMILIKEISNANAFSPFLLSALSKCVGGTWASEFVS